MAAFTGTTTYSESRGGVGDLEATFEEDMIGGVVGVGVLVKP